MATQTATVHPLENGMTLLIEPLSGVRSAAMTLCVPGGIAADPVDGRGLASVLAEMTMRGAGARSSKELSDDLDRLGIQRESAATLYHTRYHAAAAAGNLLAALPLYADVVRRPSLKVDDFEPAVQLTLQELAGVADDPRSLALIELRKRHWPDPLGRSTLGEAADLQSLTHARVLEQFRTRFSPSGTLLGIAGDVDPRRAIDAVERAFADWRGEPARLPVAGPSIAGTTFIEQASEQTHIGIACPYVRETDEDYYVARVAAEVLSGGTSGRLFGEIREAKGLCYNVGASYAGLLDRASLLGYAGTSNDRAQATLDAFVHEMKRFAGGVDADEVERAKIGLMSSTVMSGESTRARAGAIVSDYFARGRVRPMEEIVTRLEAVTHADVDALARRRPLGPYAIVTVGPAQLEVNVESRTPAVS